MVHNYTQYAFIRIKILTTELLFDKRLVTGYNERDFIIRITGSTSENIGFFVIFAPPNTYYFCMNQRKMTYLHNYIELC